MINLRGEIVGVNEISMGLAGAIPADLAREVAMAIIKDGHVKRSLDRPRRPAAAEVVDCVPRRPRRGTIDGSPAAKAGLLPGDVLLKIGAEEVTVRFAEEMPLFNQRVMRLPLGKPVDILVSRKGVEQTRAGRA